MALLALMVWCDRAGAAGSRSVTSRSYTDVDYDWLQPGTPDIKRVTVTRSRAGLLTFRLVFAKPIHMTRDFGSEVLINADRSQATGDEDGWDYDLNYSPASAHAGPTLAMLVWTSGGKQYEVTPAKAKSLRFHATARSVTFRVAAHDLGIPLAYRLRKGHSIPSLPQLGHSFTFDAGASAQWLNDAAGTDWLDVQTFPGERGTGTSIHTESVALQWLLVGLVVLVVGEVAIRSRGPLPSSTSGVDGRRWDLAVFGATGAALAGMLVSVILLIPWGVLNTFVLYVSKGPLPDAFWGPWLAVWSLVPCVVLGYLSGRWWSFLGAAPLLVLFPVGIVFSSGPADWFLTLPVTAAVAVALSFGSAARAVRERGRPARHHHPLPA